MMSHQMIRTQALMIVDVVELTREDDTVVIPNQNSLNHETHESSRTNVVNTKF